MYDDNENQYIHKISECVLETVDVSYGGDRYKTPLLILAMGWYTLRDKLGI